MKVKHLLLFLMTLIYFKPVFSHPFHSGDVAALLAIDAACDGNDSLNRDHEPDKSKWTEVYRNYENPRRVYEIRTVYKNFSGYFDASSLSGLITLNVGENQLNSINITGLSNVEQNTSGIYSSTGMGEYYCTMTNGLFPVLVLVTSKVTITNKSPYLSVSKSTIALDASVNSHNDFTISSNTSWNISSNINWFILSDNAGSGNATIIVTAIANTGSVARTATITVTGGGIIKTISVSQSPKTLVTAVNEASNIFSFVYPNPVTDKLTICLSQQDLPSTIEVFSMEGRWIMRVPATSVLTSIDMDNCMPGVYLIKVITPERTIGEKVLKQ